MPTFSDATRSWSRFKRDLERNAWTPLTSYVGERRFVVVEASRWSERHDAGKAYFAVTMTKLDRSIGHALRLVRDTGVTIVGMRAEEPEIILEPGEQWIEFAMAALGIDDKADYDRAMSAGKLGRRLRRDERERQGTLLKQIRAEHQAEVAELVADLKLAERKAFTSNPITLQQQLQEARRLQKRAEDENRALRLRLQISG